MGCRPGWAQQFNLSRTTLPCNVSARRAFAATNLVADGSKLEYDIVCRERGAARGHAVYELSSNAFTGRIAMVMGAKNMTMTEVQRARRIGECSPAKLGSAGQF